MHRFLSPLALTLALTLPAAATPPNIVLIVGDDDELAAAKVLQSLRDGTESHGKQTNRPGDAAAGAAVHTCR